MYEYRRGAGRPLLLVHGLGGSHRSWDTIVAALAREREVIALDLPGHGSSPATPGCGTFAGLADALERYVVDNGLEGVDAVGSSMGARLVLELARRGRLGAVVALDPGGFWRGWERRYLDLTLRASGRLLRALRPVLPALARNRVSRSLLLAQLSSRPWALPAGPVARELDSFASTRTFDSLVRDLARAPAQRGPAAPGAGPTTIGWGRHDRLCPPRRQVGRARRAFPSAALCWFDSGHYPMWDAPAATVRVILRRTGDPASIH